MPSCAVPDGHTVRYPACCGATTVTVASTAATPLPGIPPRPVSCTRAVPTAGTEPPIWRAIGGIGESAPASPPAAGQAVAFSAICTHMGSTVAPKGAELDCPCHGSRYNALTGEVIQGPAPKPLPKITVTINDGQVVAG